MSSVSQRVRTQLTAYGTVRISALTGGKIAAICTSPTSAPFHCHYAGDATSPVLHSATSGSTRLV